MTLDLHTALSKLHPGAAWEWHGMEYSGLRWRDPVIEKPSESAIIAVAEQLEADWKRMEYQRLRAAAYPPITDYLDAVVKGDKEQVQQYVDTCLAVKAKYPKTV
jgi:hypothetical protein